MFWNNRKEKSKVEIKTQLDCNWGQCIKELQEDAVNQRALYEQLNRKIDAFHMLLIEVQERDTDAIELKKALLDILDRMGYVNQRENYDKRLGELEDSFCELERVVDGIDRKTSQMLHYFETVVEGKDGKHDSKM